MSDRLDTQIRSLVMELVDAAPPAPSLHGLEDMERIRASAEESLRRPDGSAKAHDRTRKVRRFAALVVPLPSWSWRESWSSGAEAAHHRPASCLFARAPGSSLTTYFRAHGASIPMDRRVVR